MSGRGLIGFQAISSKQPGDNQVAGRHREEHTVEAVEHAAVAREQVAAILEVRAPLERRFGQIAQLRGEVYP